MVNAESSLEGKKRKCVLAAGENGKRGRRRVLPAAPEPLPWLGSHWQSCLLPQLGVTVWCHIMHT